MPVPSISIDSSLILPFLLPPSPAQGFGLSLAWGGCRQGCHQHKKLLETPETMGEMGECWGALKPWGVNKGALRPWEEMGVQQEALRQWDRGGEHWGGLGTWGKGETPATMGERSVRSWWDLS